MLSVEKLKKRNLKNNNNEDIASVTHVRMDRENITKIENLELLKSVTNLYLQQNFIPVIENLSCLSSTLQFLTLAGNNISKVQGLSCLCNLKFLDLSDNSIDDFVAKELPQGLVFVLFKGNKCATLPNYKSRLLQSLPQLKSIDGEFIIDQDESLSSDDDESNEEEDVDESVAEQPLGDIRTDLLIRSSSRLDEVVEEHEERIKSLKERKKSPQKPTVSPFTDIEDKIQSVSKAIVTAEKTLSSFEISSRSNEDLSSMNNSPRVDSPVDVIATPTAPNRESPASQPAANPSYVSVGTSIGSSPKQDRYITPKTRQQSGLKVGDRKSTVSSMGKSTSRKRSPRKPVVPAQTSHHILHQNNSLIRIPGARPFHKS